MAVGVAFLEHSKEKLDIMLVIFLKGVFVKRLSLLTATLLLASTLSAHEMEASEQKEAELPFYVALKGMYTFGDDVKKGDVVEKGQDGYGVGIDFGYRLGHGFAVEIDGTYESADVTAVKANGDEVTENATYYTSSLDLVYVYEATHHIGLLAKVGYEYEHEKIAGETNNDTGAIFAAGAEYSINARYKAIVEYETSTIDGPKGDMIYAGVMYNF